MKEKSVLSVLVVVFLVVLCSGNQSLAQSTAKPIELKYAHFMPATDWFYSDVAIPWLKRVEKASNGKIKITAYPGATLVNQKDMYEATKKRITDIGTGGFEYTPGVFPVFEILGLGGINLNDSRVAIHAKWETFKALQPKGVWKEAADIKILRIASTPPLWLLSPKPVRSLEDLKGMELRAAGRQVPIVKALGAVPVALPVSEVYLALQKGMIQGNLTAPALLKGLRFAEVTNAMTLTPIGTNTFFYIMNLDVWNSLPKEVQKAFDDDADFTVSEEARLEHDAQEDAVRYAQKLKPNFQVIRLSDAELARWNKLIVPVAEAEVSALEAKGLPAREVWNEMRKQAEIFNKKFPAANN